MKSSKEALSARTAPGDGPLAYSIAEACRKGGFSRSYAYAEVKAGRLKVKKAGRRSLVLADELARYLENLPEAVAA